MPIKDIDVFANSALADIDEPTTTEKGIGWVRAEQVEAGHHNWWHNSITKLLNSIREERANLGYGDTEDLEDYLTTGVWAESWGAPDSTENTISTGSTKSIVDIKAFFESDGSPRLALLDQTNNTIEVWDPRTLQSIETTDPLDSDPVIGLDTSGDTRDALAFCISGHAWVYVVFWNSTSTAMEVGKWRRYSAGVWAKAWGPVNLPDTASVTNDRVIDIINANDTYVATISSNITPSSTTSPCINIINRTTGAIASSGNGDLWSGVLTPADVGNCNASMVSDGTYLYFTATNSTTGNEHVCTATIANAQVGSGITGFPLQWTGYTDLRVGIGGSHLISAGFKGSWAAGDNCIRVHSPSGAGGTVVKLGTDAQGQTGTANHYEGATHICFDGINFWIACRTNGNPVDACVMLTRLDAGRCILGTPNSYQSAPDVCKAFLIPAKAYDANQYKFMRCVSDGRDVWVNPYWAAGDATYSGKVIRLPLAALRS